MRVVVSFQDERVKLEVPEGKLVCAWEGPGNVAPVDLAGKIARALEEPNGFPPLRQAVVPGDRLIIALGADVPEAARVLREITRVLLESNVAANDIIVLSSDGPESRPDIARALPKDVTFCRHDPDDPARLSYLATTTDGRRVYLNRLLIDADIVLPVGRLAYDGSLGYRGPWSVILPELSDTETRHAYSSGTTGRRPDRKNIPPLLQEANEVSWLLGCQLQIGVVGGITGLIDVVVGLGSAVFEQGTLAVDKAWSVQTSERAELVVVGIGRPGQVAGIGEVARGLAVGQSLARRGGKIVALSRASGPVGLAVRMLIEADDALAGVAPLKGHEAESDYAIASQLAKALAWADVYLFSGLSPDVVEGLSMVTLDRPEEVRRLVAVSNSCTFVSYADLVRAGVEGES